MWFFQRDGTTQQLDMFAVFFDWREDKISRPLTFPRTVFVPLSSLEFAVEVVLYVLYDTPNFVFYWIILRCRFMKEFPLSD